MTNPIIDKIAIAGDLFEITPIKLKGNQITLNGEKTKYHMRLYIDGKYRILYWKAKQEYCIGENKDRNALLKEFALWYKNPKRGKKLGTKMI